MGSAPYMLVPPLEPAGPIWGWPAPKEDNLLARDEFGDVWCSAEGRWLPMTMRQPCRHCGLRPDRTWAADPKDDPQWPLPGGLKSYGDHHG